MVEMPSIWWMRSPGAKKSAAGPRVFNAFIIGGYDKSKRSGELNKQERVLKDLTFVKKHSIFVHSFQTHPLEKDEWSARRTL